MMKKFHFIYSLLLCILPLYTVNFTHYKISIAFLFLISMDLAYKLYVTITRNDFIFKKWTNSNFNISKDEKENLYNYFRRITIFSTSFSYVILFLLDCIEDYTFKNVFRINRTTRIILVKSSVIAIILSIIVPYILLVLKVNKKTLITTKPGVSFDKINRIREKIKDIFY